MTDRDEMIYKNTKCSDSLFDNSKLSIVRKSQRGILQFGKSGIERDTKIIPEPESSV